MRCPGPRPGTGRASRPHPPLGLVTWEGGCVSQGRLTLQAVLPRAPRGWDAGRAAGFPPSGHNASPCPRAPPPHARPLPDGQEVGAQSSPGGGGGCQRSPRGPPGRRGLGFPTRRVSLCCLTFRGTPRGSPPARGLGSPPGAPPMPAQKDQGGQASLGGLGGGCGRGWPGQDLRGQLPGSPPPAVLGFSSEESWPIRVPISGHLSCCRLLKNNPPWARAMTAPLKEADRCWALPGGEVGTARGGPGCPQALRTGAPRVGRAAWGREARGAGRPHCRPGWRL